MTKEEYMKKLAKQLKGCDADEVKNALEYYNELLEEAEDVNEQMKSLGSPEELARQINLPGNTPNDKKKGFTIERVLVLIFTSPLWLSGYSIILSLFCVIVALVIIFPAITIASLLSLPIYISYMPYVTELLALATICLGLCILLIKPLLFLLVKLKDLTIIYTRFLFTKPKKKTGEKKPFKLSKPLIVASLALLAVGVVLSVVTFILHPSSEDYAKKAGYEDVTYYLSDETSSISISAYDTANVKVLPTDTDSAYITVVIVNVDNLSVNECESFNLICDSDKELAFLENISILNINNGTTSINVYLPEGSQKNLDIYLSLGDLSVQNVSANIATFETDLGDIDITGCDFEGLEVNNSCGDFKAKDLTVSDELFGTLDLGNADLDNVTAGTVTFTVNCGDFDYDGEIVGATKSQITNDLGDIYLGLKNRENYTFYAEADVGSVIVNGESYFSSEFDGDTIVSVYADCGNIDIETD